MGYGDQGGSKPSSPSAGVNLQPTIILNKSK